MFFAKLFGSSAKLCETKRENTYLLIRKNEKYTRFRLRKINKFYKYQHNSAQNHHNPARNPQ